MSNKEYDLKVWEIIEEFYKKLAKKEQTTWEVKIKNGKNITFHKLSEDPKQRLATLFLSSYLSTTWHKITLTEEQRNELLCADDMNKIKEYINKIAPEKESKLKKFWESVTKFLEGLDLREYDFTQEQTENFEKLQSYLDKEKNSEKYKEFICENAVEPYRTILKLQKVINGFGIALACDFLKEAHFCNIAKPDVHICHAFSVIDGISYSMDLALVKRVAEFAENVWPGEKEDFYNTGAYRIDKIIWRICKEDSLKKGFLEALANLRKNEWIKDFKMNKIEEEVKASEKYNLKCEEFNEIHLVKLTKDNVAKVESIIRTDSNYSSFKEANYSNDKYSPYWIQEMGKHLEQIKEEKNEQAFKKIVENVVEKIDKENGTHLTATFTDEGNDKRRTAIDVMVDRIIECKDNLLEHLKKTDFSKDNKTLIDILSEPTKLENNGKRRHLSFASKFCHYSCYHLFNGQKEQDNYSIYDRYVREALRYYLDKYKIDLKISDKSSYKEYQDAIDKVIEKSKANISRNGFDHLVWYYFKGNRIKNEKNNKKNKLKK